MKPKFGLRKHPISEPERLSPALQPLHADSALESQRSKTGKKKPGCDPSCVFSRRRWSPGKSGAAPRNTRRWCLPVASCFPRLPPPSSPAPVAASCTQPGTRAGKSGGVQQYRDNGRTAAHRRQSHERLKESGRERERESPTRVPNTTRRAIYPLDRLSNLDYNTVVTPQQEEASLPQRGRVGKISSRAVRITPQRVTVPKS